MVLEPDLDLGGGEVDLAGQRFALRRREVTLLAESSLKGEGLRLGEQHATLAFLPLSVVARVLIAFVFISVVRLFRWFPVFAENELVVMANSSPLDEGAERSL